MINKKRKAAFRPKDPKTTLIRLFSYFKFYKPLFILGILSIIFAAMAEVAANGMLSPIIDVFVTGKPLSDAIKYILIMAAIVLVVALGQ